MNHVAQIIVKTADGEETIHANPSKMEQHSNSVRIDVDRETFYYSWNNVISFRLLRKPGF